MSVSECFSVEVPGKWIMAGEHSVLRGFPALVYPLTSRTFALKYIEPGGGVMVERQGLKLLSHGERGAEFELLFWGVVEKACALAKVDRLSIQGTIEIESSIPIGAGLGASAALCVAVAKWFEFLGHLTSADLYSFSRALEDLFHGESSGVDVAVALAGKPLKFTRETGAQEVDLKLQSHPHLYLSYTGQRGMTRECVSKVKSFISSNQEQGAEVDLDMNQAVILAERALSLGNSSESFEILKAAIELAQSCFVRWGLVNDLADHKIRDLRNAGAEAVKMTGSGDGGFVLSLWRHKPPKIPATQDLISCF